MYTSAPDQFGRLNLRDQKEENIGIGENIGDGINAKRGISVYGRNRLKLLTGDAMMVKV